MELKKLCPELLAQFKADMQEAFQIGAENGGFPSEEPILPEADINGSLNAGGSIAYGAFEDGALVGGAIVVTEPEKGSGHLDLLYVKHCSQSKGLGKFIWFEIERLHPEILVWETCTPYFEKRNIHFYINVCGFQAVEFFNARHPDPNFPNEVYDDYFEGMFGFRKEIKK